MTDKTYVFQIKEAGTPIWGLPYLSESAPFEEELVERIQRRRAKRGLPPVDVRITQKDFPPLEFPGLPDVTVTRSPVDGAVVIYIDTPSIPDNDQGTQVRIYLNDECLFENPPYPP
jgi:hypothetical protein